GCGGREMVNAVNFVTIDHADGTATLYGHLSRVDVGVGDVVQAGQPIGRSGRTGFTNCGAHLHFSRQAGGRAVTQSVPVYFAEYPDKELLHDQRVAAAVATVELTNEAELAAEMATRLAAISTSEGADEFTPWEDGPPLLPRGVPGVGVPPDAVHAEPGDGSVTDVMPFGR
ncbi:MAG TPA: M23 family metallopeptidase, partial [Candidatus Limnocylindrales bacterium]|nr:M23 family metallopeptidase [Candidatus Limnocylindrales bacterium]